MKKMYLNKQKRMFIGKGQYDRKKQASSVAFRVFVVVFLLGLIVWTVINTYNKKELVKTYISNARSYTETQNYISAVEEYNKALKTGRGLNKAEIYRGIIYCYVKQGSASEAYDYATMLLGRHEVKGEDFKEIALMINSLDPSSAYRLLESYTETNKTDESIQQLIEFSRSEPVIPQLDMLPGTYVKISDLRFKPDDEHFGHSIFYTLNGEAPDENSMIYRGGFPVTDNIELRAMSQNSEGSFSEIGSYSFTVDSDMYNKLSELLETAKHLYDTTAVGMEIGQCPQPAKKKFEFVINDAEELLKQDNILFMDAENRVDYLNAAIEEFDAKINKNIDDQTLEDLLVFANDIYTSVAASSISSSVAEQLDALKTALDNGILSDRDQASINKSYYTLYNALLELNFTGYKTAYKTLLASETGSSYIIYDINGDMIPELLLTGGENIIYTYSVSQGKAVRVSEPDSLSSFTTFYENHNGLLACTTSDGNGDFHLITFVDNKLVISEKLDEYNTNETLRTSLRQIVVNNAGDMQAVEIF